ncbi:PREDICTED: cytochrome P450 87A3 [Theobroma cacao]|uniref:Cytochrome P450 87A3 n=1 Tax=Theobroma cacao TaxID=3641 RepID=A0AB32WY32_THECC|nr:PREDICTED: cytochrome P450 87A3 [Theobroma cacao]
MEVWSLWYFVIPFLVVSVATWISWWRNPSCNGRLPPGSMGLPLIGETLNFLVTSKSIDIHPFIKERMKRYGPLFKTSLAGRPVVVSSDPDFNFFVLQQEEKLVELYYMDSFANLVHKENINEGGYVHKYLRHAILSHFGFEALKEKLLCQAENVINHGFHEWTKQTEVAVKGQSAAMIFGFTSKILMSYESEKSEENLSEYLCSFLQGLMTFPLYIPGTAFYKCIKNMGSISTAKNFIPFGGGNRTCAGAEFSKVLMAVLLHVWVTKYRFTKIRGGDVARTPVLEFTNGFFIKVSEKHP